MKETTYEVFMRIRAELIKSGTDISIATNQAYIDAYCPREKPDPMSYKDR